jgi:3-phosphoshikimate 1-carboxyvinyltransferase
MRQKDEVFFTGEQRLFERPLDVYEKLFKALTFKKVEQGLKVKGPLPHGHYPIEGDKSSQFLTGLLFALPNVKRDTVIELVTPLKSRSYIDITLDMLKLADIHILEKDQYFMIHGNQKFKPFNYHVEGDYSQAAFFFVAGTIGQALTISNLLLESKQGDKKIIEIIKEMGGNIFYDNDHFHVLPKPTTGIHIDLEDIPDLGPILMILAALSNDETVFTSVERLRYKESDRLEVMMEILKKFDVNVKYQHDVLKITGKDKLLGNQTFDTYGDHRIAMALAIASIRCDGPIIINNPEVVSKSYSEFFTIFKQLGGNLYDLERDAA